MNIISKTATQTHTEKSLHPITILTLLDKNKQRVACTTLLDQCCTDNGIISWKLAEMLDIPTHNSTPKTFITAAGTFTTDKTIKLTNAMLPCLSTNKNFTLELMIIPQECSSDINYGAIIGQDSMHALDIDTSVCHNTISWHDNEISMVSRDYWTAERIQQQKKKLNTKPSKPTIKVADDTKTTPKELFSTTIDTTPKDYTNLKAKSPEKLQISLEQDKHQTFIMGEKSSSPLSSTMTTFTHPFLHTQNKTNEDLITYTIRDIKHISEPGPPDPIEAFASDTNITAMTPSYTMTNNTGKSQLHMT
jgi:hypothetical protein